MWPSLMGVSLNKRIAKISIEGGDLLDRMSGILMKQKKDNEYPTNVNILQSFDRKLYKYL